MQFSHKLLCCNKLFYSNNYMIFDTGQVKIRRGSISAYYVAVKTNESSH